MFKDYQLGSSLCISNIILSNALIEPFVWLHQTQNLKIMFLLKKKNIYNFMIQLINSPKSQVYAFSGKKKQVKLSDSSTEYYPPMHMLTQFYWQGTDLNWLKQETPSLTIKNLILMQSCTLNVCKLTSLLWKISGMQYHVTVVKV